MKFTDDPIAVRKALAFYHKNIVGQDEDAVDDDYWTLDRSI